MKTVLEQERKKGNDSFDDGKTCDDDDENIDDFLMTVTINISLQTMTTFHSF